MVDGVEGDMGNDDELQQRGEGHSGTVTANLRHVGLQEAINERGFSTARIAYEQRGCICRVFVIIIGQIVNEGP